MEVFCLRYSRGDSEKMVFELKFYIEVIFHSIYEIESGHNSRSGELRRTQE